MTNSSLHHVLNAVVGPLVTADRGELFALVTEPTALHLHLRGRFSGCPGNTLVIRKVIEPLVRAAVPGVRLTVTAGDLIPDGAERWTAPDSDPA